MNHTYDTLDIVELGNAEEVVLGSHWLGWTDNPSHGYWLILPMVFGETDE
jgi:hypothetical protein